MNLWKFSISQISAQLATVFFRGININLIPIYDAQFGMYKAGDLLCKSGRESAVFLELGRFDGALGGVGYAYDTLMTIACNVQENCRHKAPTMQT